MSKIEDILSHSCDKGTEGCKRCMAKYIITNPMRAPAHPVPRVMRDHGKPCLGDDNG